MMDTDRTVRPAINSQSMGEEIANAISHGVGTLLAIAGTIILIIKAAVYGQPVDIAGAAIYGGSLFILYISSTLYHSLTPYKAKRVLQIFDHCAIFILILGTYTPIALSFLGGRAGWMLFGFNALITVIGLVLNSISVKRFQKISMVLYLLMGWSAVTIFRSLGSMLPPAAMALLVGGGISYTGGIVFFALKKPRFMHFIWHLFVLAGSVLHYFFILFYVI